MTNQQQKSLGIAAAVVAGVIIIGWLGVRAGLGEWVALAMYTGLAAGGLTFIGLTAGEWLPEEIGPQVRSFCLQGSAFALIALCVLWRMYPSSFTPGFMAPSIGISELESRMPDLVGRKRAVAGTVVANSWDYGGPDENRVQVYLHLKDGSDELFLYYLMLTDDELPPIGASVEAVGVIDPHYRVQGPVFVARSVTVLDAPAVVAAAGQP